MESNVLDLISQIEILVDLDMHWKSVLNCNENVEELIKKTRLCVKKIILLKSKEIVLVLAHKTITDLTEDTMQLYVEEMKKLAHFFTDRSSKFAEYYNLTGEVNRLCCELLVPMQKQMNDYLTLAKVANKRIGTLERNVTKMDQCMEKQTKYITELEKKVRRVLNDGIRMASVIPRVGAEDRDVYTDLADLRTNHVMCVESLVLSLKDETSKLLIQREMLRCLASSNELHVPSLSNPLRGISKYIRQCHDKASEIHKRGQNTVQRCTVRSREHQAKIHTNEDTIRTNINRIDALKKDINELNKIIADLESAAGQLEDRANELSHSFSPEGQFLSAVTYVATAGRSLALTLAATGIGLGSINWNSEGSCRENAQKIRSHIREQERKRDTYKTQQNDLEEDNRINRQDIDNLQSRIKTMQSAAGVFNKATRSTDGMTSAMTPVIFKFEQMDREAESALQETERYVKDTLARKQNEEYRSSARGDIEFTAEEELQILQKKMGYVDDNIHRLLTTSAMLTALLESAENILDSTEKKVTDKIYVAIDTSVKSSPYDEELELLRKKGECFESKFEQLNPYMDKLRTMVKVFERNMHCVEDITTISNEIDVLSGNLLEAMEQNAEDLAQGLEPPVGSADINRKTDTRLMPAQQLFDFKVKWRRLCEMLLKL